MSDAEAPGLLPDVFVNQWAEPRACRAQTGRIRSDGQRRLPFQPIDDWAVRAVVAVACPGKLDEGAAHGFECLDFPAKLASSGFGERLHLRAGSPPIRP